MINGLLRKLNRNQHNQRWGINTKMTLTNSDGAVYLQRRRIVQTPFLAVYVHDILSGDEDRCPHSHPFPFISAVLRGGYLEEVHFPGGTVLGKAYRFYHGRFSVHSFQRGNGQVHRIDTVLPRTRTLVIAGRRKDSWGFFVDGEGLVHWSEYLIPGGVRDSQAALDGYAGGTTLTGTPEPDDE